MSFPDFYAIAPVVHTRDPLAALLGASADGMLDYHYADAVRLAGHSCPTVAGAFLIGRAALAALYPDGPAERGNISVRMPAPENYATSGVIAQVLTLLTGAAAGNGFQGIAGRYARNGLLSFSTGTAGEDSAIIFRRRDTRAGVAVTLDASHVPGDPAQRARLGAILQGNVDIELRAAFAASWQQRVRLLLLDFADDPRVIRVVPLAA